MSQENSKKYKLDDFKIQNQIGSGGYGKVYIVKLKGNDEIYAAKISKEPIEDSSDDILHNISREVNILSKLNHPAVLKFIFYSFYNFKQKPKPVIITEYAHNGSLGDLIKTERISHSNIYWDDTHKLIILYGIAVAMSYLHSHDIIHRDLKPDNILLDKYLYPKIGDFGFSKVEHQNAKSITIESITQLKGTPIFMAPEIWKDYQYTKEGDVYSFAMIVYEMMTLEKPFTGLNLLNLYTNILSGARPKFTNQIPDSYKKLIEKCWSNNPSNRPSFEYIAEVLKTDKGFITDNVDENEFKKYINYIDSYDTSFDKSKNIFYAEFNTNMKKIIIKNDGNDQLIKTYTKSRLDFDIIPFREFNQLEEECKILIKEAENDAEKQFIIGRSFIEGRDLFPHNTSYGVQYIKKSYKNGYVESLKYYCKMLIKGKLIPRNLKKAENIIEINLKGNQGEYFYFKGLVELKKDNLPEAFRYFHESMKLDNANGTYKFSKILFVSSNDEKSLNDALELMKYAAENGCIKAYRSYGLYYGHLNPDDQEERMKYLKIAADKGDVVAACYYSIMLYNKIGNNEETKKYLKSSANAGNVKAMTNYVNLYHYNKDDPDSVKNYVRFCKKAADQGDFKSMYLYGLLLKKGDVVKQDYRLANRLFKIASQNGIKEAEEEISIVVYF